MRYPSRRRFFSYVFIVPTLVSIAFWIWVGDRELEGSPIAGNWTWCISDNRLYFDNENPSPERPDPAWANSLPKPSSATSPLILYLSNVRTRTPLLFGSIEIDRIWNGNTLVLKSKSYSIAGYLPAIATSPLLLVFAYLFRRSSIISKRELAGRCVTCGYDLRSSPDRCPECGTAKAK